MKNVIFAGVAVALFLCSFTLASATTTVCSPQAAKKFKYGDKAELQFAVPPAEAEKLTDLVKRYALDKSFFYSGAGVTSSEEGYKTFTHILQLEPALDIFIDVDTDSRTNRVTAKIYTFSFSCGPTQDWKPYWRDFETFISTHYRIQKKRLLNPKRPATIVGG